MNKEQVLKKAYEFCEKNSINNYPVNIVGLCENYGLKVYEEYLPTDVSGFVIAQQDNFRDYDTNKLIVVNLSDSPRRRRFTIAHELAHYILHKTENDQVYAHRDAGQHAGMETEANIFASHILMPKHLIKQELANLRNAYWGDIAALDIASYIADKFAVSTLAAQVRLDQPDLVEVM